MYNIAIAVLLVALPLEIALCGYLYQCQEKRLRAMARKLRFEQ